ncbi:MAG TPA: MOSC domain-containing protein [Cytophagales bacterium]|jgi:uncharacterized protein YcbX|nr:MOSC domain-containing protein [Cytophagales bacterium]
MRKEKSGNLLTKRSGKTMNDITVTQLWIYPVKSMRGISVKNALVEEKGFVHDRRWMLVDRQGKFITQRKYPVLTQFQPDFVDGQLQITFLRDKSSIAIPDSEEGETVSVELWDDTFTTTKLDSEINAWFSEKLDLECFLVHNNQSTHRKLSEKYVAGDRDLSFADGYPYLLANEASLKELNSKLNKPVNIDRFRPNIVVSGNYPFAEDRWQKFTIGEIPFLFAKPCPRCVVIDIDQSTGASDPEILKTLASFRMMENKVMFGINIVALKKGGISLGEKLKLNG